MSLQTVCTEIYRKSGRAVFIAATAQLLLLAAHTDTSAGAINPPAPETLLRTSAIAGSTASDGYVADGGLSTARSQKSMAGNAIFTSATSSRGGSVTEPPADKTVGPPPHPATADNRNPDWDGIWRDTGILFGAQVAVAGIIYTMPESVSNWSSEQKKNGLHKYAKNAVDPVIDKDEFYLNYVLHPYWGATYYIRGRERGLDRFPSFVYSTLISVMYEFGIECFFEKPSIQDLIVTPVVGSLLGAFIFEPLRDSIKRKEELRWYDHATLIITDPVGVLSLGFEKMFGIKSTITVDYSNPQIQKRTSDSARVSSGSRFGVVMRFPLD